MIIMLKVSGQSFSHPRIDKPSLEQLQKIVGGYIEIVNIYWMGKRAQMIVDEEGRMKGNKLNPIATGLYGAMALINKTTPADDALPEPIVGDVVLLTDEHMLT